MRDKITPADLRQRVGLTQQQVAIALGKSVSIISKWERFEKAPRLSFSDTKRLLRIYRCTLDELIAAFDQANPDEV